MNDTQDRPTSGDQVETCRHGRADFVRVEALRGAFPSVVRSLGGDPGRLLSAEGISADLLDRPDGVLNYRAMIDLMERAAIELECPDFALRLARHSSEGLTVLGPLEIAMRNARTIRSAFEYCAKYIHVYSAAVQFNVESEVRTRRSYLMWDLLLEGVSCHRQVAEHALGLACNAVRVLSNGLARPQEIWFTHGRKAPLDRYRDLFGVPIRFGMPYNALYLSEDDLQRPIVNGNPKIYEMATSFIDRQFPLSTVLLTSQVRVILARLLATGRCTQVVVAEMLAMHPRTFQRRLRDEGTTFEAIVDLVRREIARRNLTDSTVTLVQIAEKLGYSETSVLTRSCHRWFDRSPKQVRKQSLAA